MRSEARPQIINSILHAVFERLQGELDVRSFRSYLLSLIFVRQLSLLADLSENSLFSEDHQLNPLPSDITVPYQARFSALFEERQKHGNGKRIDDALHQIEDANKFRFAGLFDPVHFVRFERIVGGDIRLRELLELLWEDAAISSERDLYHSLERGAHLYDAAINYFAEFEGKRGGEFSTPSTVCKLFSKILKVNATETVCDPMCGSGTLLTSLCLETKERCGALPIRAFGQEINQEACSLAKMNLFIHGQYDSLILQGDTLQSPRLIHNNELMKFDVVASHPPFQSKWNSNNTTSTAFPSRFNRGIPPDNKADFAFISHMLASLQEQTGRMAVVVAHGVLFRGGIEAKIRERLLNENLVHAVISLPPKLFFNTGIPTAILVFKKNREPNKRDILFIDASLDFIKDKNINYLNDEHISRITSTLEAYKEETHFSRVVAFDEIQANDYSLNVARYVDTDHSDARPKIDINELRAEHEALKNEIAGLDQQIRAHLTRLRLG